MTSFFSALYTETLKARRSKVPLLTALGFCLAPVVGGLFMIILKDPEQARSLGLISTKAQLVGGSADWISYFALLAQATAVAGAMLFALVTSWVFGREFSDHTAKDLLALPVSRGTIVAAKFVVIYAWGMGLMLLIYFLGLAIGAAVQIPGWSMELAWRAFGEIQITGLLTIALVSPVALIASAGKGYLPALGWALLTLALAQIFAILGWGGWFPWSVPALYCGAAGPRADQIGLYSYLMVGLTFISGLLATYAWWRWADQNR